MPQQPASAQTCVPSPVLQSQGPGLPGEKLTLGPRHKNRSGAGAAVVPGREEMVENAVAGTSEVPGTSGSAPVGHVAQSGRRDWVHTCEVNVPTRARYRRPDFTGMFLTERRKPILKFIQTLQGPKEPKESEVGVPTS